MTMRTVCFRAKYFSIVLAMSAFLGQSLFAAGSGTIKGKILDKLTGDPLIGANVVVVGTSLGASSNIDGEVTIHDVPVGEKTLKISYIGYLTISEQVVVPEGGVVDKEFRLQPQPIEGQEVVVTAQARGQNEAINEQLASANVTNVVSAEKMKELPDANIAESIGRLPGVSLGRTNGEADKVIIRGMSAQFNNVTIEGVPMVSTGGAIALTSSNVGGSSNYSNIGADRSIDLSMISDDLVKGVEVSKTLMPNMDANALGGTVNLTLREAQSGLHGDLQVNGGYNDLTKYWKNYKVTGSMSDRFFDDALGVRAQISAEDKTLPSQQFNAGYAGVSPNSAGNALNGVVYSYVNFTNNARLTQDNLDRKRYSGSFMLDYSSDILDLKCFNIFTRKQDHDNRSDFTTYFDISTLNQAWGEFQSMYTTQDFTTDERTHSIQGRLKLGTTELDASYSYTKSNYSNPVYAYYFVQRLSSNPYGVNANLYAEPSALLAVAAPLLKGPSIWNMPYIDYVHNYLNDNSNDTKADYHIPFRVSDDFSGKISIGGKYHEFDRVTNGFSEFFNMHMGRQRWKRAPIFGIHAALLSRPV